MIGYRVFTRLAPERLRGDVEAGLSRWLDAPIAVGEVEVVLRRGPGLLVRDVRAGAPDAAPLLAVDRALVRLDLRSLALGDPTPRRVEVVGVQANLTRTREGVWKPDVLARLAAARRHQTEPEGHSEHLRDALRLALRSPPTIPTVVVRDAELRLLDAGRDGPDGTALRLAMHDLRLRLGRRLLGRGLELHAQGRVGVDGEPGGLVEALARLDRSGGIDVALTLDRVDLAVLLPYLGDPARRLGASGHASGTARWSLAEDARHELSLQLDADDLRLAAGTATLGPGRTRLRLVGSRSAETVRIEQALLAAGRAEVRARGSLQLPLREASHTAVALEARELELAHLRELLLAILPERARAERRVLAALRDGRLASLALRSTGTSLGQWRELPRRPLAGWPGDFELAGELVDARLELPDGRQLTQLGGQVRWTPERLQLNGTQAVLSGAALPRLDLAVEGIRHLGRARRVATGSPPPPPLPGWAPLWSWIASQHRPGGEPSGWAGLGLKAQWIDHPVLFWPLEQVRARLDPGPEKLEVQLDGALWGGVPVRGRGSLAGRDPGRIALELTAAAPADRAAPARSGDAWALARIETEVARLGRFPTRRLSGRVRATGTRVVLDEAELLLAPQGHARGSLELDLAELAAVPFDGRIQVEGAELSALIQGLSLDPEGANGSVVAGLRLQGRLHPGAPLLGDAAGPLSVHARDGEVRRRLPALLAIASAADRMTPFRSRESIPYRAIDAELELADGRLSATSLSLDGPALRMVATGSVDVLEKPHELEAVVGLFFFPGLDAAIGKVPVLSRLLLGPDQNLVSGYFALTGPWEEPGARLIPTKSLASGPASVVVEGLPGFVIGGVQRVSGLVAGLLGRTAPPATEAVP